MSRKQIRAGLGELHKGPGIVLPEPTPGDRYVEASTIFCRAAAGGQKRRVDLLDVNAPVLDGFDGIGDLNELAGGFVGIGVGAFGSEFHSCGSFERRDQFRAVVLDVAGSKTLRFRNILR
jgi:hypothetical protein